jgi:DNA replication protein DnaC
VRDFPEDWLDYDFRSLDKNKGRIKLLAQYKKFVEKGDNSWMYLYGGPNSGRTFSAAILTNDIAKKNLGQICFLNCSQRIRELTDLLYNDKNRFQKELDRYSNVPVLVLDDFGNEFKTDMIRDAILFPIISARSSKRLLTILTSDFKIDDIITLYSTSKPGAIRAKQIGNLIRMMAKEEINFGDLEVY